MKEVTIADAIDGYLESRMPPRVKKSTYEKESSDLRELAVIIGTKPLTVRRHNMEIVEQISKRVQVWVEEESKRLKPSTLSLKVATFSRFFRWCMRRGYLFYNPTQFVQKPRIRSRTPPTFTFDEYQKIVEHTAGSSYCWFTVCSYRTGMSMVDVCCLKWDSVDMDNLVISKQRQKLAHTGANNVIIPFLPGSDIHVMLQGFRDNPAGDHWPGPEYVCAELASEWLSNRPGLSWKYTCMLRRIGIRGKSAMHWRHTFLSAISNSGTATSIACKMSGHSNPNMLVRYVAPDVEAMRAGIVRANEFMEKEKVKLYEGRRKD